MQIFSAILPLVMGLIVLSFPVFLIIGVLKFFELKNIANPEEKKKQKKKALKIVLFPILLLVVVIVLWGLFGIGQIALQGA